MDIKNAYIVDGPTPKNTYLSPKFKESFAYKTMSLRAPVIITKLVDYMSREVSTLSKRLGPGSEAELKEAIGDLSKLKYELETSKSLVPFTSNGADVRQWNTDIEDKQKEYEPLTYYTGNWLFTECYLYRRISEVFLNKNTIRGFDPYEHLKTEVLEKSLPGIIDIIKDFTSKKFYDVETKLSPEDTRKIFELLFKNALWSNKIDLCISGASINHDFNIITEIEKLESKLLTNDFEKVYPAISSATGNKVVNYILDNSGYELLSDLLFADFLVTRCGVSCVQFRAKPIPWFVSDVTPMDFVTTLEKVGASSCKECQFFARRWKNFMETGQWKVFADYFWVLGLPYTRMPEVDPRLYDDLSRSALLIFKGDLNYRKLVQDMNWEPTVNFSVSLGKFHPAPLVTLRTCKADTIAGLRPGVAEQAFGESAEWLVNGEFAVIQFDSPKLEMGISK